MFGARAIFNGSGPYYPSALWKRHEVQRLAADGSAETLPAALQIVSEQWNARAQVPYLIHVPERDRLAILAQCEHQPVIITSDDRGATWSRPRFVSPELCSTPDRFMFGVGLTYLGSGRLIFTSARGSCYGTDLWQSDDYGGTRRVKARWATLIARGFLADPEPCPRGGARRQWVATLTDPDSIGA